MPDVFDFTPSPAAAPATAPAAAAAPDAAPRPATREEIANALYPNAPSGKPPTSAEAALTQNGAFPVPQLDEPSAAVAELRKANGFDSINLAGAFKGETTAIQDLLEAADLTASPEQVAKNVLEFKAMAVDLAASNEDVQMITSLAKANLITPPSPEQMATDRRASVEMLRTTYGARWQSVLADAQAMVQRDPRLGGFLNSAQLGDDPRVVARLCELAQDASKRAFLNRK